MRAKATAARAFRTEVAFRSWLKANHARMSELFVRCYKTKHREQGVTYREALDEALCFGWIDGVRYSLDAASFAVRFTPRKTGSRWSLVNTKRAKELEAAGRMTPSGLAAYAKRRSSQYSFESSRTALSPSFRRRFRADAEAWRFFGQQPPWYQRTSSYWVMSAKRDQTREKRFGVLVECSAAGQAVPPLRRPGVGKRAGRRTRV